MGDYATYSDVQPRVAGRDIGASTEPTATQVTTWCTAAENLLLGTLTAADISAPAVGSNGGKIITHWIAGYVAGLVREAWDATTSDTDATGLQDRFEAFLQKILDNPSTYDAILNGASSDTSNRCLGYVVNNTDDKSIADNDFDPEFTIDMEW